MNGAGLDRRTLIGGGILAVAGIVFLGLHWQGVHQTILAIPAALGWAAALYAVRPMVDDEHHAALNFAFGVMALMIFFLHETYEYTGSVRLFPLAIGYAGIVFSVLDILSLTSTPIGRGIIRYLGAALDPEEIISRSVSRELIVFAAMAAVVVSIYLIGFLLTTPLFIFAWMRFGGGKTLKFCFYTSFFSLAFIYLLFEVILRYELYLGILLTALIEALQSN